MDLTTSVIILLQHVLVGLIGCVGNLFVLFVYLKRLKENEISTLFILYLAITDLTCCFLLMPINCYFEMINMRVPFDFLCKFHTFLNISNITYSCFLMTLVAVERYFSIIWPMHGIINKTRAKSLAFILFVLCLLFAMLGSLAVGIYHQGTIFTFKELENSTNGTNRSDFNELSSFNHYKNISENASYSWERAECFPNDMIINREAFGYIRLVQNSLPVICFCIIFILYATIYISVTKRRRMKQDRDIYYKKIVTRSKLFTKVLTNCDGRNVAKQTLFEPSNKNNNCNNNNYISRNASNTSLTNLNNSKSSQKSTTSSKQNNLLTHDLVFDKNFIQMEQLDFCNNENLKENVPLTSNKEMLKTDETNNEPLAGEKMSSFKENKYDSSKKLNQITTDSCTDVSHVSPAHEAKANDNEQIEKGRNCITFGPTNNQTLINNSILMANIKTAFMLFIVTVIMAIAFTPALLISFGVIKYDPIHWNLYFISNAANPIVYSFLNANFRNSLKTVLYSALRKRRENIRRP